MKSLCPSGRLGRHSGFSLIEILLASVLLAGAGGLLMASLVTANRSAMIRADQALLGQLLASQLALLDDPLPGALPSAGPLPPPFEAHSALVAVDAMPLSALQQVTLGVEHGPHRTALVTWRRPHPDDQP